MSDSDECEFVIEGEETGGSIVFDDSDCEPSTPKNPNRGRNMEKLIQKSTDLCRAILKESPDALDKFDGDINIPGQVADYEGFTPFCMAAHCGRKNMYRKMVFDLQADPTFCSNGVPPVTLLIRNDPYYCRAADNIPELVHCGADPNDQCRNSGRPPLAEARRLNIALALVQNGAGKSLHYTVRGGTKQLWQFLPTAWLPQLFAAAGENPDGASAQMGTVREQNYGGANAIFTMRVDTGKIEAEAERKNSLNRAIKEETDEEAARRLAAELEAPRLPSPPAPPAPPAPAAAPVYEAAPFTGHDIDLAESDPELAWAIRNSLLEK